MVAGCGRRVCVGRCGCVWLGGDWTDRAGRAAYRIEGGDEGLMRGLGDDIGGRARRDYGLYGVTVTVTDWTTVAPSVTVTVAVPGDAPRMVGTADVALGSTCTTLGSDDVTA